MPMRRVDAICVLSIVALLVLNWLRHYGVFFGILPYWLQRAIWSYGPTMFPALMGVVVTIWVGTRYSRTIERAEQER